MRCVPSLSRLRPYLQPATYLGIGISVFIVATLLYLIDRDRQAAYAAAVRNGANLARAFEEYLSRTFQSCDNTLLVFRKLQQQDPAGFSLAAAVNDPALRNELTFQFTIVGPDGTVKDSSWSDAAKGADRSGQDAFRVHADSPNDELFISKPLILESSGKWGIVLSRKLTSPDGSFAGVIAAVIDPHMFEKFYGSIDLGEDGIASLVGLDGVIRARGGGTSSHAHTFGRSVADAPALRLYRHNPAGSYWNVPGTVDSVQRLITYRVLDGLPLMAIVGISEKDIYKHAARNARVYYGMAVGSLAAIAITIGFAAARQRRLDATASQLARTNMLFETALDNMPHGLCMFGPDRRLMIGNRRYSEMYGLTPADTQPGASLRSILDARVAAGSSPANAERYVADRMIDAFLPEPGYIVDELRDGRVFAISRRAMPDGGSVAIHQDITAQKQVEAKMRHLAHYDALTDLANRVLFLDAITAAAGQFRRNGRRFAVHLLDLDRFKEINDSLGHAVGDALLREVARRLRNCVRDGDIVARLGGDEFAVLQSVGAAAAAEAAVLADDLLAIISSPFEIDSHHLIVETSIGTALAPDHGLVAEQLLKRADLALYRAKFDGRHSCRLFEPDMEFQAAARHALMMDLRESISRGDFELHYQPIIRVSDRATIGMEALVRWRHSQRGLVPPSMFIPLAEETGLIIPLGEWILRAACAEAATWPADIKIAVNLSPSQFRRNDLLETVKTALAVSKLPPERLELEVTESVLLEHNATNLGILRGLQALGIAVVLDDFGTGYSSLSFLQRFRFDKIKIDRSFVAELARRSDCMAIVCAVTGLARNLGIATTAEGVENGEQLVLLSAAGCDEAQGYLFGRPRAIGDLDPGWKLALRRHVA